MTIGTSLIGHPIGIPAPESASGPNQGSGTASATTGGAGEGYALHSGSGTASAATDGAGEGYAAHYGSGEAAATTGGTGEGLAPTGTAPAEGSGIGTAVTGGAGEGYALHSGSGTGTATTGGYGEGPQSQQVGGNAEESYGHALALWKEDDDVSEMIEVLVMVQAVERGSYALH